MGVFQDLRQGGGQGLYSFDDISITELQPFCVNPLRNRSYNMYFDVFLEGMKNLNQMHVIATSNQIKYLLLISFNDEHFYKDFWVCDQPKQKVWKILF